MNLFSAPIPGQSLTDEPRNYPWERPPEISDPEEVIQMYLDKLSNEEALSAAMVALENNFTIRDVTSGILRVGVSKGFHSIDAGMIAAPVLHHYIKKNADDMGVEYKTGFETRGETMKKLDKVALTAAQATVPDLGVDSLQTTESKSLEEVIEEDIPEEDMELDVEQKKPQGLMARR